MSSVYYKGATYTILITDDGEKSIASLVDVHRANINAELARANMLIKVFADNGKLRSPDQFRKEGDGFWAIRANHIRLYGWYEPDAKFVISHAIYKAHDKLAQADVSRMTKNQAAFRDKHRKRK